MVIMLLADIAFFISGAAAVEGNELSTLHVSENGRFIVREDGTPFFYLGDTAWGLFEELGREEVDLYLQDRASKRFTVIQAVLMFRGNSGSHLGTNAYGHKVLINDDPLHPNEDFFRHVDYIVDKAESLGLHMGILPVWGGGYIKDKESSKFNTSNAREYGKFLGSRYHDKPIIWILGGDWPGEGIEDIWAAMAQGLAEGDGGKHLMSYHPRGGQASSKWFHNAEWLDFNMIQSGHSISNHNYDMIAADYHRKPVKPVIDGEPGYENITNGLKAPAPDVPLLSASDVRRFAYCAVFAGAAGHTYGCNEVYQFWVPGNRVPRWGARIAWREAIKLPGSSQMQYLRNLVESRPMMISTPDQSIVVGDPMKTIDRIQAVRGSNGSYAFIYTASGSPVNVQMGRISGETVLAYWYDPRNGKSQVIGKFPNTGDREFAPPSSGMGNDWVLVLDDAAIGFPEPGSY